MRYPVAALQFNPILGEYQDNARRLLELVERAAKQGAKLIVAPEMATPGYCFYDRDEVAPFVEPVPGPLTEALQRTAGEHECWIVSGLAEIDHETELFFNSAVLVGPQGLVGKYRKIHFFDSDAKWAVEGNLGFPVWATPLGRIGIEICRDAIFPEPGRLLALQGADVICFPTNWVSTPGPDGRWSSQAFENGVYWIAADRSDAERGIEFMAGSCIIEPDGSVQATASGAEEEIVFGEVDLSRTERRRFDEVGTESKLADRRPDLYRMMLQNTYGWNPPYFQKLYGAPGLPEPRESSVAVIQMLPAPGDRTGNLDVIAKALHGQSVDILVLPELALTGFPSSAAEASVWTAWNADVGALASLSRQTGALVATTLIERDAGRLFNTAVLVEAGGAMLTHRKAHFTRDDRSWAEAGNCPPRTVDTPFGRIGLLAGYDALFWEMERVLSTQGADLICVPAALRWPEPQPLPGGRNWIHWRTKAWESCVGLALANYPGPTFAGGSGVWMPQVRDERSREWIAPKDSQVLVPGTIDTASRYIREKRIMAWRRYQWYAPLVHSATTLAASQPSHSAGASLGGWRIALR